MSQAPIFIYDPTYTDTASKVRGIGRYVQGLAENFGTEVVFTHDLTSVPWNSLLFLPFFNFLGNPWLWQHKYAKTQIAVIHDIIPQKYPQHFPVGMKGSLISILNTAAIRNFDAIITDSNASKTDLEKAMGNRKKPIYVVYPPLSTSIKPQKTSSDQPAPKHPYALYVGDVTWNKNISNIAQGLKIANIHSIWVGNRFSRPKLNTLQANSHNPWEDEAAYFIQEADQDDLFDLRGFVSNQELAQLYSQATVNLLISRDEGFGYSYFEAAQFKTPSILANRPIFKETAGDAALFVDPEDPIAIADAIKAIFNSPKLRQDLGEKAYLRSKAFTGENFAKDLISVFQQVTVQ